jgi:hypothetical protein
MRESRKEKKGGKRVVIPPCSGIGVVPLCGVDLGETRWFADMGFHRAAALRHFQSTYALGIRQSSGKDFVRLLGTNRYKTGHLLGRFPVVILLLNPEERSAVRARETFSGKLLWHLRYGLRATATGNPYPADVLVSDWRFFYHG